MEVKNVHLVAFSPCGGSRLVLEALSRDLGLPSHLHDLTLPRNRQTPLVFEATDLVFLGFPVYAGRLPQNAALIMSLLAGCGAPAVLTAVYGNRAYEGALLELDGLARDRGFQPLAAVAAIAEHSLAPEIAANRPDQRDKDLLAELGLKALSLAKTGGTGFKAPGFYAAGPPLPPGLFLPGVDLEKCVRCGQCAQICSNGAISEDKPEVTEPDKCVYCGACLKYCPEKARALRHPQAGGLAAMLHKIAGERKEPEFFI